jgi:hypothetical protein
MSGSKQQPAWLDAHQLEAANAAVLRTSSYIFEHNHQELIAYIAELEGDLDLLRHHDQEATERKLYEATRLLHNEVSAGFALREVLEKQHDSLHGIDHTFPEFQSELERRIDLQPLVQIVRKIRDYMVHHGPVAVGLHGSVWPDGQDRVDILLDLTAIRRFSLEEPKRWRGERGSAARLYLETAGREVSLKILVVQFNLALRDFGKWFCQRENELQVERLERAGHPGLGGVRPR